MYLKQLSVFVDNKPGALYAPCSTLADAGVNLSTIFLADTKDFGIMRIITKDAEKALAALRENNFAVKTTNVLAIEIEDVPGALSKVLKAMESKGLNVLYMYAAMGTSGKPVMIFRFDDADQALEKLSETDCKIISSEQFFAR
ncbi:MAG: ACT domain-containing protein [Lentisphaeria bacterium]|nr:ACT domain-containing protein [Lentisphaeria bacterium]